MDDGLAIVDTMDVVSSPVHTVCLGKASSMAAIIMAAGEKGHRCAAPKARLMVHEPSRPLTGPKHKTSELKTHAAQLSDTRSRLVTLLAERTGQPASKIEADFDAGDLYMSAAEARAYGLVDADCGTSALGGRQTV